ncbi:SagB/ThcOx family dehydrogenase [Legionella shakespearei]|uniref:Nitroreductase n=1 Tax=Legionella shakespearei DSM 23087 TaxID=1122169 RepID=A0A0W0YVQ4_9GAMM|nr:SagB/ThcOx family dehydrogenase [Legionella shakespearei]KTD60970.1 nitroreductase [Legionella shakespearei DSM 23087]
MKPTNKTVQLKEIINRSVWGNTYDYRDTSMTVGFKTNTYRFTEQKNPQYAFDFLKSSIFHRHDAEQLNTNEIYLDDAGICTLSQIGKRTHATELAIQLPPVESMQLGMSLDQVILNRRSSRNFRAELLSFKEMAQIIQVAAGITGTGDSTLNNGVEVELHFRAAASAGALYPIDLYVATQNIEHINNGVYGYDPLANTLIPEQDADIAARLFRDAHVNSADANSYVKANLLLIMIANPWRSMRKYGPRGLRFILQECGSMSQNIHLAAVAQGLASVDAGGFYDEELHEILKIDGLYQTFLHAVVVGKA